jgi:hypothetical protein
VCDIHFSLSAFSSCEVFLISVFGLGCSFLTIAGQFFIRQVRASKDATFLASSRRGFARPASTFGLVFSCVGPVLFLLPASTSRAPGFHSASQIFGLRARFQVACPVLSVFIVFLLSSPLRIGSLHPPFLFACRSAPQFFVTPIFPPIVLSGLRTGARTRIRFPPQIPKACRRFSVSCVQVLVPARSLVCPAQCALVSDFHPIRCFSARCGAHDLVLLVLVSVFDSCRPSCSRCALLLILDGGRFCSLDSMLKIV